MRVLVTGSAGFLGHHLVDVLLNETSHDVVGLDRLDCSSTLERLRFVQGLPTKRFKHIWHDLRAPINDVVRALIGPVDVIFHLAASTHVDRSITDALPFVYDNVVGTAHTLEYARTQQLQLFYFQSTDEIFGPAPAGVAYKEWDRSHASNPYSATKQAGEELALAYHNTYGVPVVISHLMNLIGERQHPEKFLPLVVRALLRGEKVLIHADRACSTPGSRFYIYVRTATRAIMRVLDAVQHGTLTAGDKINIPGGLEVDNLTMAQEIARAVGAELRYELVSYHANRPGHDARYALDATRYQELRVESRDVLDDVRTTVRWYLQHKDWLLP